MTPFYTHLKGVPGFAAGTSVDQVGVIGAAAVGTAFTGHALVQLTRKVKRKTTQEPAPAPAPTAAPHDEDGEP
jgi:hypothetical protein